MTAPATDAPVRVMVVDDSLFIRRFISRILENDGSFKVVATASNGQMAIGALRINPADVVILDIEMPVMDGLTAIPQLKAVDQGIQIIMASTLTQRNADISLRALSLGATDYIPKPSSENELNASADFSRELIEKVKTLGGVARRHGVRIPEETAGQVAQKPTVLAETTKKFTLRQGIIPRPDVIAIGSSTGGPQALFNVIGKMGANLSQPIVITQHMPPAFTTILAERISHECKVHCKEAADGEVLKPGCYYVAPGDNHLTVVRNGNQIEARLNKTPPENYCRPAVDPMLRSLVEVYGKRILVVILTGMGSDGWKGSDDVVKAGGAVIAQDEATSIVWGMPGSVAMAGLCTLVLPIDQIGQAVFNAAKKS